MYSVSRLLFLFVLTLPSSPLFYSQTGPGGVGNITGSSTLRIWLRADAGVTQSSGAVSQWRDQSGYGNHFSMATVGNRPGFAANVFNGLPVIRYSGASQYFTSGISGPNSAGITIFLFAKGSSYQSLVRYQNQSGVFMVYPWEVGGGRTFITSTDGGTGSGLPSGIVNGVKNLGTARYDKNTNTSGFQTFLNGNLVAQRSSANSNLPNEPLYSGRYNPGASEYPTADVSEIIIYYSALNEIQRIIVENYLAAKYDTLLASNDIYTMDNAANGNYDYDVAGIGRGSSGAITQTDSRGTGIVRVSGASNLGNNESFMWGRNSAVIGATTSANMPSASPQNVQTRWTTEWRVSEVGDVGNVDISFDLSGYTPVTAANLRLLIDTDNDGLFSDEVNGTGVISGATHLGSNVYEFAGINIADARRFTLGSVNQASTPLPVTLINFTAHEENGTAVLEWETAREQFNQQFNLYHSLNGMDWTLITTMQGQDLSAVRQQYSFRHEQATAGINYYKLEDQDHSGHHSVSKIVTVNIGSTFPDQVLIYPNPSSGKVFVHTSSSINSFNLQLFNLCGKSLEIPVTQISPQLLELDLAGVGAGLYLLGTYINDQPRAITKLSISDQ